MTVKKPKHLFRLLCVVLKPRIRLLPSLCKCLFLSLCLIGLAGCVTEGVTKRKVDKEKVLESHIKLGMAYLGQNQRDSALRAFIRALEIDKNSPEANQGMAMVHHLNGEFEQAEDRFQRALRSRSDKSKSDIQYAYGRFLLEKKRYAEALELFESASKDLTYNQRVNALYSVGACADKLGDEQRAIAAFKHALNLNANFAPAALELADKMFARGEFPEAKRYLDLFTKGSRQNARSLWLGIRIERTFGNKDKEASYALALRNLHPYSREFLEYKKLLDSEK